MHITWDGPQHADAPFHSMSEQSQHTSSNGHRKLKKKVSFAAGHMPAHEASVPAQQESDQDPLLTPFGTYTPLATGGGSGGLKSAFRKLSSRKPPSTSTPVPDGSGFDAAGGYAPLDLSFPSEAVMAPAPPSPASSVSSEQSWQHHDSYFPDYEPLFPSSSSGAGGSSSDYAYTDPFLEAMTPLEIQQEHHNAVLGQSVAIHYPDLPAWSEYAAAGAKAAGGGKGEKAGWYTGKWGTVDEWTGYGWEGEKLPTASGATFGVPMKEGIEIVLDEKKKQGGGEGGGGGGGGEGGGGKKKKK